MKVAIIPGDAGAQERQHHGKKQELGSGLQKPYFQLHWSTLLLGKRYRTTNNRAVMPDTMLIIAKI